MQGKFQFDDDTGGKTSKFMIYTDGACEPNPGIGGWGFVAYANGGNRIHEEFGGKRDTTNNVMEMTGLLEGVSWALKTGLPSKQVTIRTDSMYVVNGCNSWRFGWKKRGWRRSPKAELANADLWKRIDAALNEFPCRIEWVKGHNGEFGNERADKLAGIGRQEIIQR